MLHRWVIPIAVVLAVALWAFYLVLKSCGGTGLRTEGKTLVDKPEEGTASGEEDLPPGQ